MAFDILYETITGQVLEEFAVAEAENLYQDGKPCDVLYEQVQAACSRVCGELGVEEHKDLTLILDSMDKICKEVSREVFRFCTERALK